MQIIDDFLPGKRTLTLTITSSVMITPLHPLGTTQTRRNVHRPAISPPNKISLPFCEDLFPLERCLGQEEHDHIDGGQNGRHDQQVICRQVEYSCF
jgi:hypothetical protein